MPRRRPARRGLKNFCAVVPDRRIAELRCNLVCFWANGIRAPFHGLTSHDSRFEQRDGATWTSVNPIRNR